MTQQIINVGAVANDGTGTPLRTAFEYINDNFDELYANIGVASNISNGTSTVRVVSSGGNIVTSVGGTSNVVVWATSGEYVTGLISASGNITGGNITTASRVISTPTALANLTAVAGARAFVNNGNLVAAGNFGAQIGSGGANTVPVWSDGTNWYIG